MPQFLRRLSFYFSMQVFHYIRIGNEFECDHGLPVHQVFNKDAQSEAALALVMPNVSTQPLFCISLPLEGPSACLLF
jgi:hypothetical protein